MCIVQYIQNVLTDGIETLKGHAEITRHLLSLANKQQEQQLKRRRPLGALLDLGKKENPTSAKYVIEDVSNSLYRILPYHLAPGYVQYTEEFEAAWNFIIKNQMIEKELFGDLRRSILHVLETIFRIVNNSESLPNEISKIAPGGKLNPDARVRQRGRTEYSGNGFPLRCEQRSR